PRTPVLPRDRLEPGTRAILEAFPARGTTGPAELAVKAGVDLTKVNAKLGLLAAAGFVERASAGWRLTASGKAPKPLTGHPTPPEAGWPAVPRPTFVYSLDRGETRRGRPGAHLRRPASPTAGGTEPGWADSIPADDRGLAVEAEMAACTA